MEQLNCIIIEDQIPAQKMLESYIEQVPHLNLLSTYISPLQALGEIENGVIDIMFLDIHMPKLSGLELLKSLKNPPQTILTTAFSEYALDGFELDVVDYLLKPFSFERFLKAISKVQKQEVKSGLGSSQSNLFIRNKGQIKKIAISEIEYIEAKGDFTIVCTNTSREIANISLQKIINALSESFIRCHKSYIININFVEKIIGNHIVMSGKKIPIGRTYKDRLIEKIKLI